MSWLWPFKNLYITLARSLKGTGHDRIEGCYFLFLKLVNQIEFRWNQRVSVLPITIPNVIIWEKTPILFVRTLRKDISLYDVFPLMNTFPSKRDWICICWDHWFPQQVWHPIHVSHSPNPSPNLVGLLLLWSCTFFVLFLNCQTLGMSNLWGGGTVISSGYRVCCKGFCFRICILDLILVLQNTISNHANYTACIMNKSTNIDCTSFTDHGQIELFKNLISVSGSIKNLNS